MRSWNMVGEGRNRGRFVEGRRTWYLVLQISFPADTVSQLPRKYRRISRSIQASSSRHLNVVRADCKPLGVTVRRVDISVRDEGALGHYLFRFRRYQRDDESAVRLAEAFAFGFSLAGGPLADTDDPLVLRVPDSAVRANHVVKFETLLAIETIQATAGTKPLLSEYSTSGRKRSNT